jgi:hypothetical protein
MTDTVLLFSLETYAVKALASPASIADSHTPSMNRCHMADLLNDYLS